MPDLSELRRHCSPDVLALNPELFDAATSQPVKTNKYHATKVTVDGVVFDSKKEYRRWRELSILQEAGDISGLQRQVKFTLQEALVDGSGHKVRAITYTADHLYQREGLTYIEDVKSVATAKSESFRVRWRMLLARFRHDPRTVCVIHTS